MGGWLCLRASAFEHRIKRVIATGHAIDYMKKYAFNTSHDSFMVYKSLAKFHESHGCYEV